VLPSSKVEIRKGEIDMKVLRVTVAGALVLFAITAAFGMSVKSDYEKTYDFTRLRTYAFKTDRASNDPLNTNTFEAQRIRRALAAQLDANGFSQATQDPDFIVAFYATTKEKGTGLGLAFVDRIVSEHGGSQSTDQVGIVAGPRHRLWPGGSPSSNASALLA
jgi:hypothetical protein